MRTKLFFYSIGLVLFAIFIIQNSAIVSIKFYFWDIELPRAMLLIGSFILGAIFWAILPLKKLIAGKKYSSK